MPGAGDPRSWDRYAYVKNNPIGYNDPSGHIGNCTSAIDGQASCVPKANNNKTEYQKNNVTKNQQNPNELSFIDYIIPTNLGIRLQIELSGDIGFGLSGTIGVNYVYNRISDTAAGNVDWALEPGVGIGGGVSATGGLLIGWVSSTESDVTEGYSAILSATAAVEGTVSVAVTAPLDENGLHVDPYYNQVPATVYIGIGAGGYYGSAGIGVNGPTGLFSDLTKLLPWK